jgi:hypothetical protein
VRHSCCHCGAALDLEPGTDPDDAPSTCDECQAYANARDERRDSPADELANRGLEEWKERKENGWDE